jgi:hypothetical protein
MICGALPAVLTFFIRLFVPESEKWAEENASGRTRQWSSTDLLAVVGGTLAALAMICVWADPDALPFTLPAFVVDNLKVQIPVTVLGLVAAYFGYTYPARKYLQRSTFTTADHVGVWTGKRVLGRMLIGSLLSGVALMGTWASLQNAPSWADQLARKQAKEQNMSVQATAEHAGSARAATQIASGFGAIAGTIGAALLGTAIGRRWSYFLLCVAALGSSLAFFKLNSVYGTQFVSMAFLAGGLTASFYGWLPLYLPELFPTRVRAFGQGFAFNFGRILAAVGALQFAYLMRNVFEGSYPKACSVLSLIYLVGMVVIWFAPETHKQPLPE